MAASRAETKNWIISLLTVIADVTYALNNQGVELTKLNRIYTAGISIMCCVAINPGGLCTTHQLQQV